MRNVIYRGRRADNGQWIEGSLLVDERKRHYIGTYIPATKNGNMYAVSARGGGKAMSRFCGMGFILVDSSTVGQYAGMNDFNGRPIFEEDYVRRPSGEIGRVVWSVTGFYVRFDPPYSHGLQYKLEPLFNFWNAHGATIEVVGNIHENKIGWER